MNNNPCCHKCAKQIMHTEIVKIHIGDDNERILCNECASLIRKFLDEKEVAIADLKKLEEYQRGYKDGWNDGAYDQWQNTAGDDL